MKLYTILCFSCFLSRDQDFEFIKKWVDNNRSGVETGQIAVPPKKKLAAKSGGRK